MTEETDLLQRSVKTVKQRGGNSFGEQGRLVRYDEEMFIQENLDGGEGFRSYKEMLIEERDPSEEWNVDRDSEDNNSEDAEILDFYGFKIVERMDREYPCPIILISEAKERRMCKSWRKTLIIKLLGKGIGFKALE